MKVMGCIHPEGAAVTAVSQDGAEYQANINGTDWDFDLPKGLYRFLFSHPQGETKEIVGRVEGHEGSVQKFPEIPSLCVFQDEKYRLQVKDDLGRPIPDAQIQVFPKDKDEIIDAGTTDSKGFFECFLKKQAYEILIYKWGFNEGKPKVVQYGF